MAIAFVQQAHTNSFSGTTVNLTVSATGTGNLLVVIICYKNSSGITTTSVAGTNNGNFTHYLAADASDAFQNRSEIWYKLNSVSGDTTLTLTCTNTTLSLFAYEFSGADTVTGVDAGNGIHTQTEANPELGASVTPTNTGDVCVSAINALSTGPTGVTTWLGFMHDSGDGTATGCCAYTLPGSTNPIAASFTGSPTGNTFTSPSAAFLPAAGAAAVLVDDRHGLHRPTPFGAGGNALTAFLMAQNRSQPSLNIETTTPPPVPYTDRSSGAQNPFPFLPGTDPVRRM